jgi:hypothetical protein
MQQICKSYVVRNLLHTEKLRSQHLMKASNVRSSETDIAVQRTPVLTMSLPRAHAHMFPNRHKRRAGCSPPARGRGWSPPTQEKHERVSERRLSWHGLALSPIPGSDPSFA